MKALIQAGNQLKVCILSPHLPPKSKLKQRINQTYLSFNFCWSKTSQNIFATQYGKTFKYFQRKLVVFLSFHLAVIPHVKLTEMAGAELAGIKRKLLQGSEIFIFCLNRYHIGIYFCNASAHVIVNIQSLIVLKIKERYKRG